jgi:hypothetical protein
VFAACDQINDQNARSPVEFQSDLAFTHSAMEYRWFAISPPGAAAIGAADSTASGNAWWGHAR